jgi:hypothetical protein
MTKVTDCGLYLLALRLESILITVNYNGIVIEPLHTHQDSQFTLVVSWQCISTQKLSLQITMKSSCHFLFNHRGTSGLD